MKQEDHLQPITAEQVAGLLVLWEKYEVKAVKMRLEQDLLGTTSVAVEPWDLIVI